MATSRWVRRARRRRYLSKSPKVAKESIEMDESDLGIK
jgi:hypothetical protein